MDETYSGEYECVNKSISKIEGIEKEELFTGQKDGRKAKITLQDALFVPENGQNLSLAKIIQTVTTMHFADTDELVTKHATRFELEPSKNLFIWQMVTNPDLECNKANRSDEQCFATSLYQWHERLGHSKFPDIKRIRHHVDRMLVEGKAVELMFVRRETNEAKCRAVPRDVTTTKVIDIVYIDVLSPIGEESIDRHKYAIGFADGFSRFISVYFAESREECLEKFQEICADIGKPKMKISDAAKECVV